MAKLDKIVISTATALLTLLACHAALAAPSAPADDLEKCYGITKAGSNDCNTATASCAGSSTQDKQPDAFIFLPKGACQKIVGGSITPIKKATQQ